MQQMVAISNTHVSTLLAAIIIFPPHLICPIILRHLSIAYVDSSILQLALCFHSKATQRSLDLASAAHTLIYA